MTRKEASLAQEKRIARNLGGKIQPASGGTKFGGGDIHTKHFLIEAKTVLTKKDSFSIKLDWLNKAKEQMFEQGKIRYSLAFQFEPHGNNYYIIDESLMQLLISIIDNGHYY